MGDRAIVYQERVTDQSPEVYTKSSNGHNRIKMYVEPLDETVMVLIRNGEITAEQNGRERGRILDEKAGWDPKVGRKIWEVFNESLFIDGSHGLQRLDRIKAHCCRAFREWLSAGPLCKEPVVGIKCTFVDATVHADPKHSSYDEISHMMVAGLALCFLNAKPRIFELSRRVKVEIPREMEDVILAVLLRHGYSNREKQQNGIKTVVDCVLSAANASQFIEEIRTTAAGKARINSKNAGYQAVPPEQENQVIQELRGRKGLVFEDPMWAEIDRSKFQDYRGTPLVSSNRAFIEELEWLLVTPVPHVRYLTRETFGFEVYRGHINTLSLYGQGLASLPETIQNLAFLQALYLDLNHLDSLPASISKLSKLVFLTLRGNFFTQLPENVCELVSLVALDVSGNQLSVLPTGIGNLKNLQVLHLNGNPVPSLPGELLHLDSLIELYIDERFAGDDILQHLESKGAKIHYR